MHARRLSVLLASALSASLVAPVLGPSSQVGAHTGLTSINDDSGADISPDPTINGTTVQVRILRPSTDASKPAGGWPLVIYMPGELKNRCANINETSARTSWYTRKQLAEHGYAVLSFNARGLPANYNAGSNPTGTSGCNALDDAKDAIDDSGWDLGGPNDKADVKGLIDWAVANYTWSGCASSCIDGDDVALIGAGTDALKALLMGVPNPPNAQHSSGVKAIVAVGYDELTIRNLKDVSSDGAAAPAFRSVDHGLWAYTTDMHSGYMSRADASLAENVMKLLRATYLNDTVPAATTSWFDDRTVVDDNSSVDKAGDITTPVFLANAFLDGDGGTTAATLAFNKLAATEKFLYLGACGSSYTHLASSATGPCLTTNAANLRDKVHAFLDWKLKGAANTVGGPVFWAVPPAVNPLATDAWSVEDDPDAVWPPAPDAYTTTSCLGSDGNWYTGSCSTAAQPTLDRTVSNVWSQVPQAAFCAGSTYGSNEVVAYTSGADPANDLKLIGFELDTHVKSDTTRLQVYADLFSVDTLGNETRISQGTAQMVPVKRNGSAGTVYRFRFRPVGLAWTLPAGHKIRVKLAANYKKAFAQELLPATYTIKHTDTQPTTITLTFDI
ncbi:MAG TPA: CocE/NonD family hydrolase C-terminal non-catalytic domain-containing protein [Acidimicrobiales bacterium]|nr:CocE/NonD family hydrolase C-terminal non-catalytic domain-containing protein [Acidimicrobiales bacterium]